MAFKFLCEIQNEVLSWGNFGEDGVEEQEQFTSFYNISPEGTWGMDAMITLVYFSFTSLTTIGFGDFSPRSNWERLLISFGLVLGVAVFSVIMGIYLDLIDQFKAY